MNSSVGTEVQFGKGKGGSVSMCGSPQRVCGAREIDELAGRPAAHGAGLAAELLEAVTKGAPEGCSRLLTSVRSPRAVAFYRWQGWTQATHASPEGRGIVVFLGPCHPARTLTALPL